MNVTIFFYSEALDRIYATTALDDGLQIENIASEEEYNIIQAEIANSGITCLGEL